jgi:hypothetical protein
LSFFVANRFRIIWLMIRNSKLDRCGILVRCCKYSTFIRLMFLRSIL